jgi:NAD(P)-dependent dehydrogenase (short-subunit alcohol dehydrogenase family)
VVVTGATSGIGLAAALEFARLGDEVVLLGRDPARLSAAASSVRDISGTAPATYRADFAVLDEVRAAGASIVAAHPRIDVLASNAGRLGPARRLTVDRLDPTMQINHLAGFLLANLLLPSLRAGAPSRLITTGSAAEAWGTLDVARPGRRQLLRWLAYGASKQAALLFTAEAARRWAPLGVIATCFFPGLVRSGFARHSPAFALAGAIPGLFRTPVQAADTLLWLTTVRLPGAYVMDRHPFPATARSTDPARARRLWDSSLTAVGLVS